MERLAPLMIGLLVTVAAILGGRKSPLLDKIIPFDGCIARKGYVAFGEWVIVGEARFIRISFAGRDMVRGGLLRARSHR